MYFIICIISMLGYATQSTLMAGVYREMDAQEALTLRGLCLMVSMSPLLLWVPPEAYALLPRHLGWILLASLLGSLGGWIGNHAFRFLPVGMTTTFMATFNALLICLWGFLVFDERLTTLQVGIVGLILVCVVLLGLTKSSVSLGQVGNMKSGILCCAGFALFVSCAFIVISHVSRSLNPLLTAYSWETCIGIVSLGITMARKTSMRKPLFSVATRQTIKIFFCSAPTALGSGGYMLAVTLGPVSLVAAIGSTLIVVTTILSRFIYKEQISARQWALLSAVCILIILLRTSTP